MNRPKQAIPGGVSAANLIAKVRRLVESGKRDEAVELVQRIISNADMKASPIDRDAGRSTPQLPVASLSREEDVLDELEPREQESIVVVGPPGSGKSSLTIALYNRQSNLEPVDLDAIGYRNASGWVTESVSATRLAEEFFSAGKIPVFIGVSENISEVVGFLSTLGRVLIVALWPEPNLMLNSHLKRMAHEGYTASKIAQLLQAAAEPDPSGVWIAKIVLKIHRNIYADQVRIHCVRYGLIPRWGRSPGGNTGRTRLAFRDWYFSIRKSWKMPYLYHPGSPGPIITWRPTSQAVIDCTFEGDESSGRTAGRAATTTLPAWCHPANDPKDIVWPAQNFSSIVRRYILAGHKPVVRTSPELSINPKMEQYAGESYVMEDDVGSLTPQPIAFSGFAPYMDYRCQEAVSLIVTGHDKKDVYVKPDKVNNEQ